MSFSDQYAELEAKFKEQVERDDRDFGLRSRYLPNIAPQGRVDYILIAMEPSSGENTECLDNFRNFSASIEDFILHYCVNKYLCKGDRTYYLTDLSKGAMLTSQAEVSRRCRYKRWYSLLCDELELVAKPKTAIIAIGTVVERFLKGSNFPLQLAGRILHYSGSASRYRRKMKERYPDRYAEFKDTVEFADIEKTIKKVLGESGVELDVQKNTLERLQRGSRLTESKKQLIFTYKCQFEAILQAVNP